MTAATKWEGPEFVDKARKRMYGGWKSEYQAELGKTRTEDLQLDLTTDYSKKFTLPQGTQSTNPRVVLFVFACLI